MTFSSEIYRRLNFGINVLDEPDEHISVQEIEVSVPTRKRRISDDFCFPPEKAVRRRSLNYEKKQTKVKELTKMLKMVLLVPLSFFLMAGRVCSEGF